MKKKKTTMKKPEKVEITINNHKVGKCINCLYYQNNRCTDTHGIKFNKGGNALEEIPCPAYISAGFITFGRQKNKVNPEIKI